MQSMVLRAILVVSVLGSFACGKNAASGSDAPKASTKSKPAVLVGTVRLEPGAELPSYTPEQMERSVLAHVKGGTFPEICTPPRVVDRQPVRLTADGKLTGVMLAASEFSGKAEPRPAKVHEVLIKDCRLTPSFVVALVGDMVQLKNLTDYPLMPGLPSEAFNQTLTLNQTRDIKLDAIGAKVVSCGFTAPCGRTEIITMAHPYTAVTDDKGEFRIADFPADQTIPVYAWHPLFTETSVSVRVGRGEEKRVEFVLTPKPPPAPPKPVVRDPNVVYPD